MAAKRDQSDEPLSERIARAKDATVPKKGADYARSYNMASMAWRITLEIVVGTLFGFGLGWSLDGFFGTSPALMIVFGLFGVAAGLRVAIGSAQELSRQGAAEEDREAGESAPSDSQN